jgi:transcriptional regulator with XRE-family HTH domain
MEDFQARLREALRKRLYPNSPLHLKEVAGGIGRSKNTVTRWWRGESRITAYDLHRIAQYLERRGDHGFLEEVFHEFGAGKPAGNLEEMARTLVRSVLADAVEVGLAARDAHAWFNADGAMEAAQAGHADFVRRRLGMPASAGDLVAYAARVLGWIAVTERSDGVVIIRHDGRRIATPAAEHICEWLEDRADRIQSVRRIVHMDAKWIEAVHPNAHLAAAAVAKAALIMRVTRCAWSVKTLSLDSISDPRLTDLMRVWRQTPQDLVHAAAAMGAFTTSSLFGVNGEDVISHHVATGFGFDPRTIEGMNILSRPDTDYALMVQARILRTRREGPTYHELTGTIDDHHVRYLNLALPEPGPEGRVLTSSVVLELERLAA